MTPKETYARLAADIKEHILQEYQTGTWVSSDAETYRYFKQSAIQSKPQPIVVPQAPSLPPIKNVVHAVIKAPPPPKPAKKSPEPIKISPPVEIKKEEKQPLAKSGFQPSPMPPASSIDLSDIRKIVQEHSPSLTLIDQIPSDTPEVLILVSEPVHPFFINLTRAIDILLAPAILAKDIPPNSKLKLVISSKPLDTSHLYVDPLLYIKDPSKKALLWTHIRKLIDI